MKWTSNEACDGDTKFTFTLNAVCKETKPLNAAIDWTKDQAGYKSASDDKCAKSLFWKRVEACSFYFNDGFLGPITKFATVFEIIGGVLLVGYWIKFVLFTF